jgi:hypothetical protein
MREALWQPLFDELNRWGEAGLKAQLWLRDDDAVGPTPALARLHRLSSAHAIPIVIAAIPARAGETLARFVEGANSISVAVHGWSHANHAPASEKKQELGPHRPMATILSELQQGLAMIKALFGDNALPVLVPPWNRIDASLIPKLPEIGFAALSGFGRGTCAGIPTINTHIDLIDWHGTRGCVDHALLIKRLVDELAASRSSEQTPVGILTHHLVHDEAAWVFLLHLFEATRHPACNWFSLRHHKEVPSPVSPSAVP